MNLLQNMDLRSLVDSIATGFSLWINRKIRREALAKLNQLNELGYNLAKAPCLFCDFYPPAKAGGNRHQIGDNKNSIATGFSLWIKNESLNKRALAQQ